MICGSREAGSSPFSDKTGHFPFDVEVVRGWWKGVLLATPLIDKCKKHGRSIDHTLSGKIINDQRIL